MSVDTPFPEHGLLK